MKKIFYLFFILLFTVFLTIILHYDSQIVITTTSYEIVTNIKTVVLIFTVFVLSFQSIFFIINIITRTDKEKIIKKINKRIKKYELYLEHVKKSILYGLTDNFKEANKNMKLAEKYLKNDLNYLIKFQLLTKEKKYQESLSNLLNLNFKKEKKIDEDLLLDNIRLSNAIDTKNNEEIEIFANKILKKEPKNLKCLGLLYEIYKKEKRNVSRETFLFKLKKTMSKNDFKAELLDTNKNLAEFYFKNNDFKKSLDYSLKVFDCDKNIYSNNKILILSIRNEKQNRLNTFVEKIWKYTPKIWLGNLYLSGFSLSKKVKAAKHLYNVNKNDINSVIFFCNTLIENNRIDLINEYLNSFLQNYNYREVFKILLKIEEKNKSNSFLIEKYKEKILATPGIENE